MNLEYNVEKLQEILNRIMQRIMSILTSALRRWVVMEYKPVSYIIVHLCDVLIIIVIFNN